MLTNIDRYPATFGVVFNFTKISGLYKKMKIKKIDIVLKIM